MISQKTTDALLQALNDLLADLDHDLYTDAPEYTTRVERVFRDRRKLEKLCTKAAKENVTQLITSGGRSSVLTRKKTPRSPVNTDKVKSLLIEAVKETGAYSPGLSGPADPWLGFSQNRRKPDPR